jgi:polyisoprenoid-binding protein YceI
MRSLTQFLAVVVVALPALGQAATWGIDPTQSSVGFAVSNRMGDVQGAFKQFSGTITADDKAPEKAKITATLKAESIDTQNGRRDEHLRNADFFDTAKYPDIKFVSKKITSKGKNRYALSGELTLHGVTRPVTLDVTYKGQKANSKGVKQAHFSATTAISRKSFGVGSSTGRGAMVGDEVKITLDIIAAPKK